jgi:hypothetical protein
METKAPARRRGQGRMVRAALAALAVAIAPLLAGCLAPFYSPTETWLVPQLGPGASATYHVTSNINGDHREIGNVSFSIGTLAAPNSYGGQASLTTIDTVWSPPPVIDALGGLYHREFEDVRYALDGCLAPVWGLHHPSRNDTVDTVSFNAPFEGRAFFDLPPFLVMSGLPVPEGNATDSWPFHRQYPAGALKAGLSPQGPSMLWAAWIAPLRPGTTGLDPSTATWSMTYEPPGPWPTTIRDQELHLELVQSSPPTHPRMACSNEGYQDPFGRPGLIQVTARATAEDPPVGTSLQQAKRFTEMSPVAQAYLAAHADAYIRSWNFTPAAGTGDPSTPATWTLTFAANGTSEGLRSVCAGAPAAVPGGLPQACQVFQASFEAPQPGLGHASMVGYETMFEGFHEWVGMDACGMTVDALRLEETTLSCGDAAGSGLSTQPFGETYGVVRAATGHWQRLVAPGLWSEWGPGRT